MDYEIDTDRLRRDLMDYYGTAMCSGFPMAVTDLSRVECADDEQLVEIAQRNGVDLSKYMC